MNARDDSAARRSGMTRLISPWEYRHLRTFGSMRFAAGGFQLGIGVVLLGLGRRAETAQGRRKCDRWAAWFLVNAALQFFGGYLDMTADRSVPPRT